MLERLTGWLAGEAAEDLVPRYLGFNAPFGTGVCLVLLALAGAFSAVYYWRRLGAVPRGRRLLLVGLRTAVIVLALFLVLDPSVIAQHVRPGEQFVALLFDDSLSMRIGGREGLSRGARLIETYGQSGEAFEERLKRRHQVVRYRVGDRTEPLQEVADLRFNMRQSDLTGGIARVLADLEGTAVSAVVLFSDGVQRSEGAETAADGLAGSPPVFTVGVDEESVWRDIELTGLSVNRTDFDKSPVVLTVGVHSTGLAGQRAVVEAGIGSRTVKAHLIEITEAEQDHEVRLEFVPDRKAWIEYEARVRLMETQAAEGAPAVEDRIAENNLQRFVVDNREKVYRILYVSGRPSWQNKFFRLALEDDRQLKLTSLIAISNAERKFVFRGKKSTMSNPLFEGFEEDRDRPRYDEAVFLRLGAAKDELTSGYPTDPEDLFVYDLVVLGDVEREFFSTAQMELTRDYVDKRGGNLLMLGGPNSFTEGRYAGTLFENMMPVLLYQDTAEPGRVERQFEVTPTIEGRLAGSWSFATDEAENDRLWSDLPPLYGLNRFPMIRAGATVMAVVESGDETLGGMPVFAVQRYGEGQCAVLASGDTWQWQMGTPHDDERHGRFWRQIVRNLIHNTPPATLWRDKRDAYTPDEEAEFAFVVRDDRFDRREALQCTVVVTTPSGEVVPLPVEESIIESGLYSSRFQPAQPGLHKLSLAAIDDQGEVVGKLDEAFLVEPDHREFQQAEYNGAFLRELAETTGGRFFSLDELDELAAAIPAPAHLDTTDVRLHLWHLPGFYVALVAMMVLEWYLRRKSGQA